MFWGYLVLLATRCGSLVVPPAQRPSRQIVVRLRKPSSGGIQSSKPTRISYRRDIDVVPVGPIKRSLQRELRRVLRKPSYEITSSFITILACALFAVHTLPDLEPSARTIVFDTELVISFVFACEYGVRWFASGNVNYPLKPLAIVDLISFLPAFIDAWQDQLSFLRLLRVFRLQRLLSDTETFAKYRAAVFGAPERIGSRRPKRWAAGGKKFFTRSRGQRVSTKRAMMRDETLLQLTRVLSTLFTLLFVSSGLIFTAEHEVNENIPDFFTALYFGLTTLTTVGFGDITPVTPNGRLVVSFSILVGIGVIPVQVTSLAESLLAAASSEKTLRGNSATDANRARLCACANCGQASHRSEAIFCFRCGTKLPA